MPSNGKTKICIYESKKSNKVKYCAYLYQFDKKFRDLHKKGEIVKVYITPSFDKRYSTRTKGSHKLNKLGPIRKGDL